ncbi:hypothetical protein BV25DRAFT_1995854 [Artomyces pyxidatus]|uniref:Uncharacterized protein n=1 Tax=Artomyces pyxidatus TaxID=48021 RepID=A0ACB8SHM9_9AGAM|nr:hypothetical protein BV25DRAFT_1995854 [Artomyces pyxidatus]
MKSSESSPLKRRRHDTEPPPLPVSRHNFKKSEDVWLEDGNVIILCDTIGFRVHQSILSFHSNVFKDTFSTCTPVGDHSYEGCPIVTLYDEAEEMHLFLRTLYFRRHHDKKYFGLRALRSLLKLSRKYMVDELYKEITDYLKLIFPSTLAVYLSERRLESIPQGFNPITGVEIGLEFDILIILPAALYMSALLPLDIKLDGSSTAKPSDRVLRSIFGFEENLRDIIENIEHDNDWHRTWTCPPRTNLTGEHRETHDYHASYPGLSSWFLSKARQWHHSLYDDIFFEDYACFPGVMCRRCISSFKRMERDTRESLWDALPDVGTQNGSSWGTWEQIQSTH